MFEPRGEYDIVTDKIDIADFHKYPEDFVVRPPYQRKNVWGNSKQQALLDSLFRRYYIPRLVLREVRLGAKRVVRKVVDGQQRITTVQRFFKGELRLPATLDSLEKGLGGLRYSELPADIRKFVDKQLKYEADVIKNIDDPKNAEHQRTATEIFWRLQQGETLNFMEVAHARLSSPIRNFLVKYADDITFDYDAYQPVDENPDKHPFFRVIERNNDRMQHLSLLGRLLLIERANGPVEIRDKVLADLIDSTQSNDGVGNYSYEETPDATALLKVLSLFHNIFKDDPMVSAEGGMKEFRIEYFIVSVFMLIRHLRKYYALDPQHHPLIREFLHTFHQRWSESHEDDRDILAFANSRQQDRNSIELRDRILRQIFFEFLQAKGLGLKTLDSKRAFNEAERIRIYRRDEGLCQECLRAGKDRREATVPWGRYEADHLLPWIKGGKTEIGNAQVLCSYHNASKGSLVSSEGPPST